MAARNGNGKNSGKNTGASGPKRDALGRLTGGNPGNSGGKPGRSGRPPKPFKTFCRETAKSAEYQDALKRAATTDTHDDFIGAAKLIANYATSKPAKKVDHTHRHFTNPRDVLADRLAKIVERN
jgi:hypothetical protein